MFSVVAEDDGPRAMMVLLVKQVHLQKVVGAVMNRVSSRVRRLVKLAELDEDRCKETYRPKRLRLSVRTEGGVWMSTIVAA